MNSEWGFDMKPLLWLLAIVPMVIVAYAFDGQRRRRLLERIGGTTMLSRMTASYSPARRRWKAILTVAALVLLLVALARPYREGKARLGPTRGLDLVVAIDLSRSMLATDVHPSRLVRAKQELSHLVDGLKGDRLGVVVFAGETMSYPLTIDYDAAKLFWRDLSPSDMPVGGTDLGRAISAATDLLLRVRKPEAKRRPSQVILLLTDGEDTEGHAAEATRKAKDAGIKIFTLGIGSTDRPYVQLYNEDGREAGTLSDENGQPVRVGLDETALKQIAAVTGADYVHIDRERFGVERIEEEIAGLERTEEESRFERQHDDIGRYLLLPACVLLLVEMVMRERRRSRATQSNEAVASAASASPSPDVKQRSVAALILLLPLLFGFDLFERPDPNVEEGNRLLAQGKAEEALRAYDRVTETLKDEPIVRFDRGTALYQLGRFVDAQKEFERATEGGDPQLKADAFYNMGNTLFEQKKFQEAIDAYKRTLGLRPDDRRAKWNLELALRRLQKPPPQKQPQQGGKPDRSNEKRDEQAQKQPQPEQKQKQQEQQQQQQQDQQQQQQQAKEQQEKQGAQAKREPLREIDKQDAEAVLDQLESNEPTVQKDLARRRAANRHPTKDW
jgi:Ca-activated chloride channel family protein